MGARSNIKGRVPSCRGTEGPRASHHSYAVGATDVINAASHTLTLEFDSGEIFKKTPCAAGLQPRGRYVAKDMRETGGIPLLMKTLFDMGRGNCLTDPARTIT
jgi:dihydroxyacid dehydratase/phosphogluconate dehydratase